MLTKANANFTVEMIDLLTTTVTRRTATTNLIVVKVYRNSFLGISRGRRLLITYKQHIR